jgi:4-amino-4-deoxy-L-arabinose transferase-like glycosyltransferase
MQLITWLKKNSVALSFVGVLVLASFLRLWNLGSLPNGFHSDEVMNGYVGRYVLENGKDLYGNPWPILYFDHFGDFPNILPMYVSGLGTVLFGSTVFGVRFPIALIGIATVILVYALSRWLWKSPWVGLLAALCLAVFPWHVVLSRATAEGVLASASLLFGVYWLFLGIEGKSEKKILFGSFWLLLCNLFYPGFRILVPLVFLPGVLYTKMPKLRVLLVGLTLVAFAITLMISRTEWGKGRFEQTSFLAPNHHIETRSIQYGASIGEGKALEARVFYNRYVLTARELLRQYASYFSPQFLAAEGGKPPRYLVPEQGLIYWTPLVILVLGGLAQYVFPQTREEIQKTFHAGRAKYFLWILWILMLAPIPAALTFNDVPNVHRAALLGVFLPFLFAPVWYLLSRVQVPFRRWFIALSVMTLLLETLLFWQIYTRIFSVSTSLARQDEQIQLAQWLQDNASKYEKVFVPGNEVMPLYYLFVQNRYPADLAGKFSFGISIDHIDNVYFVDTHCPASMNSLAAEATLSGRLFVERSECEYVPGFSEIGGINRLDITKAYDFVVPMERQ